MYRNDYFCLLQKYWTAHTQSMHTSSHTPSLNFSLGRQLLTSYQFAEFKTQVTYTNDLLT